MYNISITLFKKTIGQISDLDNKQVREAILVFKKIREHSPNLAFTLADMAKGKQVTPTDLGIKESLEERLIRFEASLKEEPSK